MENGKIADLERRLRKIEDIEEIRNLRMRYHQLLNEGLWDQFGELFTDDASVDYGYVGGAKGKEAICQFFLKIPQNADLIKQFIHNHIVEIDGDTAKGISYLDARYAKNGDSIMLAGQFSEEYVRTNSGWLISDLVLKIYFSVPLTVGWAGDSLNFIEAHE